jgi:hypothetical protein
MARRRNILKCPVQILHAHQEGAYFQGFGEVGGLEFNFFTHSGMDDQGLAVNVSTADQSRYRHIALARAAKHLLGYYKETSEAVVIQDVP